MAWSYKDFEKGEETNSWDKKRQETEQAIANLGDFKYNTYTPSDAVNNYQQQLQNHEANKVADWTGGTHGATLNDILNQINNREKFSYDLNGDALYQQYKDQYMTQGNMAMMDTIGQASAMTGGYGNSYAQSVGQQTYQGYLQQLNDRVPELYQMALNKYNMEGDQLLNQYNITSDAYNKEYGVHRDTVADWENQRSYLQTALNNERTWDYGQFSDAEDRRLNEYNLAYGKLQDSLNRADTNYWSSYNQDYGMYSDDRNLSYTQYNDDRNYNFQKDQADIAQENWQKEYDLALDQLDASNASKGVYKDTDTGKYVVGDTSDGNNDPAIPDNIKSKAASFESNTALENYLTDMEHSGAISHEQALQLLADNTDHNEKDGKLGSMVDSTNGWSVVKDGGPNWLGGIDNNAIVKSPNGDQYRLDNLVDALVSEGYSKKEAKAKVLRLQRNLGGI